MAKNEIKVAVVVDDSGAKKGVKSVEGELNKLDKSAGTASTGIKGKFDSAFSSTFGKGSVGSKALSEMGINADKLGGKFSGALPVAAAVAGGAIAKFALDSASKFGDLGLQVEKFSTVAGTSASAASRFIAVADDYGVSADTIAGSVGKLGKTLGTNIDALDQYGVAVARGKDGNVDLAATTFNVIDAYNKTTDPAKKAALGAAAFGKSYQELIPLIDVGSDQIRKDFASVDKAQVFSDAKVKEAKDYRKSMDDLHDAFYDFQLTVGKQVIPVMGDMIGTLTTATGALNDLGDAIPGASLGNLKTAFDGLENPLLATITHLDDIKSGLSDAFVTPSLAPAILNFLDAGVTGASKFIGGLDKTSLAALGVASAEDEIAARSKEMGAEVQRNLDAVKGKWDALKGSISDDQSLLALQQQFDDVKVAGAEAFDAAAAGADDAEKKTRDAALAADGLKLKVIDYGREVLGLPQWKVTELLTEIDKGNLAAVEARLEQLTRDRVVNVVVKGAGGPSTKVAALGATVSKGDIVQVGERGIEIYETAAGRSLVGASGIEMLVAPAAGRIIPNDKIARLSMRAIGTPIGGEGATRLGDVSGDPREWRDSTPAVAGDYSDPDHAARIAAYDRAHVGVGVSTPTPLPLISRATRLGDANGHDRGTVNINLVVNVPLAASKGAVGQEVLDALAVVQRQSGGLSRLLGL